MNSQFALLFNFFYSLVKQNSRLTIHRFALRTGLEPIPSVLETEMLPLHYRSNFCWFIRTRTWTTRVKVLCADQLHYESVFWVISYKLWVLSITHCTSIIIYILYSIRGSNPCFLLERQTYWTVRRIEHFSCEWWIVNLLCSQFLKLTIDLFIIPFFLTTNQESNLNNKSTFPACCHYIISGCGSSRIRTYSAMKQQIYSLPRLSNFGVLPNFYKC